jgi:hypothetical protein
MSDADDWQGRIRQVRKSGELADLTAGEIIAHNIGRDLVIDKADPCILIAGTFIKRWLQGQHHPSVSLTENVVRIKASNRTVIYRLIEYLPDRDAYIAEWPD